ncbi:MAG: hypothetical protein QOJ26_60 [Thermoplasmata archaeon]|jgi:hypothetical protein|nr:hypothetical protein [Thermoplasmata archaeon]MEA3165216.1 hypothetical protein [Thermoplasmata archaeon]
MFLHRLAAGLVFAAGAGVSRLAVAGESLFLMGVGLGAAIVGLAWFASGGPSAPAPRHALLRYVPEDDARPTTR